MNVLSLFDGISCGRVALERAGIKVDTYYASEIDKYAIQISQKNYPEIRQLGDVKRLKIWEENPNAVDFYYFEKSFDLLIGGSPCQDLSIAKKGRQGLSGERSGLFWEYVRILREVKPKYFILENVNSMPKEAKEIITKELGVEPIMINAALVSAQNRKRLFWTNIPNVTQPEDRGILLKDILQKDVDEGFYVKNERKNTLISNRPQDSNKNKANTLLVGGTNPTIRIVQIGKVGLSTLGGGGGAKTGLYCVGNVNPSGKGMNGFVYSSEGKSPNITTNKGEGSKILNQNCIRKLTPIECERLQGLPDKYTDGISNSQRYKCLGNAFNVDVVCWILSFIPKNKA